MSAPAAKQGRVGRAAARVPKPARRRAPPGRSPRQASTTPAHTPRSPWRDGRSHAPAPRAASGPLREQRSRQRAARIENPVSFSATRSFRSRENPTREPGWFASTFAEDSVDETLAAPSFDGLLTNPPYPERFLGSEGGTRRPIGRENAARRVFRRSARKGTPMVDRPTIASSARAQLGGTSAAVRKQSGRGSVVKRTHPGSGEPAPGAGGASQTGVVGGPRDCGLDAWSGRIG